MARRRRRSRNSGATERGTTNKTKAPARSHSPASAKRIAYATAAADAMKRPNPAARPSQDPHTLSDDCTMAPEDEGGGRGAPKRLGSTDSHRQQSFWSAQAAIFR